MALETADITHAMCAITAAASGAGLAPTFALNRGFVSTFAGGSTHIATGVYVLALDVPVSATNVVLQMTFLANSDATGGIVPTSTSLLTAKTFVAAAASDVPSFNVVVFNAPFQ